MHMREREGGGHLHRSGMKTGLSLCLEKVNNEKMEGSVWNEVSWGVVEVQEIHMREGGSQGSLAGKQRKESSLAPYQ